MYQAGIKNITLYENRNISFDYWDALDSSQISNITAQGSIITIENVQQPEYEEKLTIGDSGEVLHEYSVEFLILEYTIQNINLIAQLKRSIYGWCFLVEYYDGTFKFFNSPVYCRESKIKPHDEMSFEVTMESETPTVSSFLNYTPDISTVPVYRWDTTLLTWDNTIYTFDYGL